MVLKRTGTEAATRRNKRSRVRLSDVAERVGVSAITVSRALRDPDKVSVDLRRDILQVIKEMGYVPDLAARALAGRHSGIIAVLAPAINTQILADIMCGIEARIRDTGLQTQYANTMYSGENELEQVRSFLAQNPAGMIFVGTESCEETAATAASAPCPIAYILDHSQEPGQMVMTVRHMSAGEAATRYLWSRGYRRIALIGGCPDVRVRQRLKGYENVLRSEGALDSALVIHEARPTSVALGCKLFSELLDRAPDIDAVLCQNDDLALGVLFECQRRGIRVPEDLGICGVNNLEFSASTHPPLTTVHMPRFDLGFQAADMLVRAIAGEGLSPKTALDFTLIARGTTR
ncbi:LacI family DNA-binding transcriptional regulator [Rhizobium sp. HT1-10]|uniref:LacI family DNA-binding transcriptional regulator n=1 Tax=Rhizobium sp. HT1-10 TaxID=3111638 RepID=UPI003C2A29CA